MPNAKPPQFPVPRVRIELTTRGFSERTKGLENSRLSNFGRNNQTTVGQDHPDLTGRDQWRDQSTAHLDPLDAALLVAAKAGDATTVARIVELMHARQRASAGNVVTLEDRAKRT